MVLSLRAVALVPLLVAAFAAPALADGPMLGVSIGGGLIGPPTNAAGALNTNVQWSSGLYFRGEPAGSWSEASIGILSRGQSLSQAREKVFETSGLTLSFGAKAWFLHVGIDGEFAVLNEIVQDPNAAGTLMFHKGAGVLLEPYVAGTLPFLKSGFSQLDLSFHYPLYNGIDPSIGPRVELTLWLGTPPKGTSDDQDSDEESEPAPKAKKNPSDTETPLPNGGEKKQDGATVVPPEDRPKPSGKPNKSKP